MKKALIITLLVVVIIAAVGAWTYAEAAKRRRPATTPVPNETEPETETMAYSLLSRSGGGGGGGGGDTGGGDLYTLTVSVARDPGWWPFAQRITLNESQRAIRNFTLKFYQGTTLIRQRNVNNLNTSTTPFLTFVPFNDYISTPGTYKVEVSTVVGGITVTASANFTLTSEDLPTGYALNAYVNRDPQWWPFSQRISLVETVRGTRDYVLTFKTATGTTISTRTVTALNTNSVPFLTFTPANEGITTQGAYQVTVGVTISGTPYSITVPFSLTADDFASGGSGSGGTGTTGGNTEGWVEPADPNANVEMIVTPSQIIGRFKLSGGSGSYNCIVKKAGVTVGTGSNLAYSTYVELTINRFYNQQDLAGQTLSWEFEKASVVTAVSFFTPEAVYREYDPKKNFNGQNVEYPEFEDRLLQLRYTKPFNNARIKLEDVGENAGMVAFYQKNGSIYFDGTNYNATILSPRLVPAMRHIQIIKFLIDSSFGNINRVDQDLFYGPGTFNKQGARLEFWIRTAANQNI